MLEKLKRQSALSLHSEDTLISPLQIERCIVLLKLRQDSGLTSIIRGATTTIQFYPVDHKTCEFEATRGDLRIIGTLQRWEGTSTQISYQSKIHDRTLGLALILMLTIIGLPFGIFNLLRAENLRHHFVKSIIGILLVHDA